MRFSLLARLALLAGLGQVPAACGQTTTNTHSSSPHRMQQYQTEKFKLSAGPCAADGYFVMIQSASFINSQGGSFPVPSGHVLRGNWGASGTAWAVGDEMQAVPERLTMLWFSYAEDKFYKGDFALPQEKLYQLLQQGSWDIDKNKQVTYDEFVVCVLPKGGVAVWLSGGNQVLVGRFQAQETVPSAADYQRYYGDASRAEFVQMRRGQMPAAVQTEIKAGTMSTKKWDEYLKTYPWQVAFNVPVTFYRSYSMQYVSAEYTNFPLTRDDASYNQAILQPSPKPVPSGCFLYLQAEHGAHHLLQIRAFDEAETMAAFQALHAASPASPSPCWSAWTSPCKRPRSRSKTRRRKSRWPKASSRFFCNRASAPKLAAVFPESGSTLAAAAFRSF